jgi:hypothetical protein
MEMRACRCLLMFLLPFSVTLAGIAPAQCPDSSWRNQAFWRIGEEWWVTVSPRAPTAPETWIIHTSDPQGADDTVEVYVDGQLVGTHQPNGTIQSFEVPGCVAPADHELGFLLVGATYDIFDTWCFKLDRSPCSQVIQVALDIKPGTDPNKINLGSKGVIPVAILSDANFDATTVLPMSVELAGAGVAVRGDEPLVCGEDIDADGDVDLVLQVEATEFDPGPDFDQGYVTLTGVAGDGTVIEGEDYVIITPSEG